MIIYPAIDVRGGKVVRLREGDPNRQTIFSDDPVNTARRWIDEGASWLHMVNLEGAFSAANNNLRVLESAAKLNTPIQFGGGMRQMGDIERAFACGASRVVLGTVAIQQPEVVTQAIERWGQEAVCIGLDARYGKVTTHGWSQVSDITPLELGKLMAEQGVIHALYTDVSRDGGMGGGNIKLTIELGRDTGLNVIASGGISSLVEIEQLAASNFVAGAIIGMALYEGRIKLSDAIKAASIRTGM
jgi:phosphoribosylformimino-5-aminoimidazole carboxamide ribotide isomerase